MTGWDAVGERWTVEHGDCLRLLALLEDASVDSVVTDPPYELGFMAKEWDSTGIAYRVDVWRECLRVLKPGGHLLAFGGSRTYHRMACAIEDAGFEIRDQIMWVYGSGFPKSLDVSKAIDKRGGYPHLARQIGDTLRLAREARGLTVGDCDRKFCGGTTNWSWFEGRPKGQRAPTPDTFAAIAAEWPEVAHCARLVDEAEREVVGKTEATYGYQRDGERWDKTTLSPLLRPTQRSSGKAGALRSNRRTNRSCSLGSRWSAPSPRTCSRMARVRSTSTQHGWDEMTEMCPMLVIAPQPSVTSRR